MKKRVLIVLLLLITLKGFSQASGDSCAAAVSISLCNCTGAFSITNTAISAGLTSSCTGNAMSEGWYLFSNPSLQTVIITGTTASLNTNLQLQLFSGSCGSLTEILCEDAVTTSSPQTETATLTNLPIGTYYLRLVNAGTAVSMNTSICITTSDAASCPTALPEACNSSNSQRIIGNSTFTTGIDPTCTPITGTFRRERWYSYTMPSSPANQVLSVTATTTVAMGNVVVQLIQNNAGTLTELACANNVNNTTPQTETATYSPVTGGATYLIRILDYNTTINSNLTLSRLCINTTCQAASSVPLDSCIGPYTLYDLGVENTTPAPSACAGTTGVTITREGWFAFTSVFAGSYSVTATSITNTTDLEIQVLSGTCGDTLVQVACANQILGNSPQTETVSINGDSATTYFVRIINCSSVNSDMTISNLCVHSNPVGIENDINEEEISISPNPFTSQTAISFSKEQKSTNIKIIDVLGKEIKSINFSGKQLLLEKGAMHTGIYLLRIEDINKNILNRKIIVQ